MKNIKKRLIGWTLGLALSLGVGIGIASNTHSEIAGVEAAGETTVTMDSFTSISGNVDGDKNVSYLAEQGNANTAPGVYDNQIRIYQNGGLLTVSAKNNTYLTSVTIGSAMATSVTYVTNLVATSSAIHPIPENAKYPVNLTNKEISITFKCVATGKKQRLYLNYLSVVYGTDNPLSAVVSATLTGDMTQKKYHEGDPYVVDGLSLSVTYDNGEIKTVPLSETEYTLSSDTAKFGDTSLTITGSYSGVQFSKTIEGIVVNEALPQISISYSSYRDNLPDKGYDKVDWNASDIRGKVFSIKNNDGFIQFKANDSYLYNEVAVPGYIKRIVANKASGSFTDLTAFVGNEILSNKPSTGGVQNGTTWDWSFDVSEKLTYFRIDSTSAKAKCFSSIVVEYEKIEKVDPTGITIDNSTAIVMDTYGYGNRELSATVEPFNANDTSVIWGTADPSVVTVDNGVLTPVAPGSTTVYATTSNFVSDSATPALKASVAVTVEQASYKKATFEPTSTSTAKQLGDFLEGGSVSVASTKASYDSSKKAIQLTAGTNSTFTISGYSGKKIVGLDLAMSSNGMAGSGSLVVTSGTNELLNIPASPFSSDDWNGAYSATPCDIFKGLVTPHLIESGKDLTIKFASTANSIYIHGVSIRYVSVDDAPLVEWCQNFLNGFVCDATGATRPDNDNWDIHGLSFLDLDETLRTIAKNAVANPDGSIIEKAMAKYDYVIAKYGTTLFDNYIERTVSPVAGSKTILESNNNSSATALVTIVALASLTAAGGFFFIRKRKEQN